MGIASCLEPPRFPSAIPDSPPEELTPGTTSCPSGPSEETSWNPPAPPSPPMSNDDPTVKASDMSSSPRKGSEETTARKDTASDHSAPREQLPPLSSLFGPPTQIHPLHSALSDRQGSYTPSSSPLDRPLGPTGVSSSYFPSSTAALASQQPRSVLDPRFQDRPQVPPLSLAFPGPLSPQPRQAQPGQQGRPEYGAGSQWSAQHEASREYSLGSREYHHQLYKSAADRYPAQLPGTGRDESRRTDFREQLTPQHPAAHNPPAAATSSVGADVLPTKDGLGPKIWTGTHFLPRFVRAAEVPGEGMCYFYDDGSYCKTVIDGEAVNALWGVTKAGKPRKRLAIACVTCREKKIKCDPDYPRCVQCEKFGRVCKFKNAPRGGHSTSPSTSPAEPEDARRFGGLARPTTDYTRAPPSLSRESVSPRTTLRPASPGPGSSSAPPLKRARIDYEHYSPTAGTSPMASTPDTARSVAVFSWRQQPEPPPPPLPRIHEDVLCRAWQTDPYVSDPQCVTDTISSLFVHADAAALRFLPAKASFLAWLQNTAHRKSPEDLMLVYSVLAAGAALSPGGKTRDIALEYAQVARYATEHHHAAAAAAAPSLQLVQARIALALCYLAVSRPADADDVLSAAIAAATCLQLNLELDESRDRALTTFPFGLTRAGYATCRNGTFWSCFLLERLSGQFPTRVAIINTEDIFIRLPADGWGDIERTQGAVAAPVFEPPSLDSLELQKQRGVGIMGCLVQVTALWGEVMASIYRVSHRRAYDFDFDFAGFRNRTVSRLAACDACLPAPFRFSPANNLDKVPLDDDDEHRRGAFVLAHLVFHLAMVKLHRHVHPRFLLTSSSPSARRHLRLEYARTAREHASRLLDVVCAVARQGSSTSTSTSASMPPPPPPLFTSLAVLEAADVLSAQGAVRELPGLIDRLALGRRVLEVLGTAWGDVRAHRVAVDDRLGKLQALRDRVSAVVVGVASGDGEDGRVEIQGVQLYDQEGELCWRMADPLEGRFPREMDCVYDVDAAAGSV
ncbi:hypothetical protein VTK56DRAFT_727 [Thermocarpiscus australiensis]